MVNFEKLKEELLKFNGTDLIVSMIGRNNCVLGVSCCKIMEFRNGDNVSLNICNIDNLVDGNNPISVIIDENNIKDIDIKQDFYNEEIRLDWDNGDSMLIIGN